ncbi:MAG: AAA family ATPase [Porticoccaceae bacterium]
MTALTIAFAAGKGGVGKTTCTALVAQAAAHAGRRVLAVDADSQGSLLSWSGDADGLGAVSVVALPTARLDRELPAVAAAYDVAVIDCPPGVGDQRITEAALRAATLAVVPMAHTLADLDRLRWTLDLAHTQGAPAVVLLNKMRTGTRSARDVLEALEQLDDVPVLQTTVPLAERVAGAFGTRALPDPFPALWAELADVMAALTKGRRRG